VDEADIGKTFAAKHYCKRNRNAVYIDASQVKSRQRFVRHLAREFGVGHQGRYADVYDDLVFLVKTLETPLVVIDEAGDLSYPAFLELKALWNATSGHCGWYMMGADGLKAKVERNIRGQKVGYTELFSRFGSRFQKVSPNGAEALREFKQSQLATMALANGWEEKDLRKLWASTGGSLRRLVIETHKKKGGAA